MRYLMRCHNNIAQLFFPFPLCFYRVSSIYLAVHHVECRQLITRRREWYNLYDQHVRVPRCVKFSTTSGGAAIVLIKRAEWPHPPDVEETEEATVMCAITRPQDGEFERLLLNFSKLKDPGYDDELRTVLTELEGVINQRPLTHVSDQEN